MPDLGWEFEPCHVREPHLRHTWGPCGTADHFCAGVPPVTTCADCGCEAEAHNDPEIGGCVDCGICGGLR